MKSIESLDYKIVKDVIHDHYLNDINFPRSCGSVSMILTLIFQDSKLKDKYDISYIRGHFRNDFEEEYCECEFIFYDRYDRFSDLNDFDCTNCTCEYMVGHSWIELKDKYTNKVMIVDFTNIQFEENFPQYHSEILESNCTLSREELFEYLKSKSVFIIDENNKYFKHYIPSERVYSGKDALNELKENMKNNIESDVTVVLNNIGYKLSI